MTEAAAAEELKRRYKYHRGPRCPGCDTCKLAAEQLGWPTSDAGFPEPPFTFPSKLNRDEISTLMKYFKLPSAAAAAQPPPPQEGASNDMRVYRCVCHIPQL